MIDSRLNGVRMSCEGLGLVHSVATVAVGIRVDRGSVVALCEDCLDLQRRLAERHELTRLERVQYETRN